MIRQKLWMRAVMVFVVVLIGWVVFISSKHIDRSQRIQLEISALETEAAKIRRENETLAEKIKYFSSADFREQEAKKKLGLKKSDEVVVLIKSDGKSVQKTEHQSEMDETDEVYNANTSEEPNYKKWWKIFF